MVKRTLDFIKIPAAIAGILLNFWSCSHSPPKTSSDQALAPSPSTTPSNDNDLVINLRKNSPMGVNEYLDTIVLPKIVNSGLVHDCFLDSSRASKRELASGHLSFQFEIKLEAAENQVNVTQVYLSSIQNLPNWAKPCLISGYKKFIFPPFPDPTLATKSAFGEVNMTWEP